MKRIALLALLAVVTALPASADTWPGVSWEALPCTHACAVIAPDPCVSPPPDLFYADVLTGPAPAAQPGKVVAIEASLATEGDWDLWLCSVSPDPTTLASAANVLGEPCDNRLGANSPVPLGCSEHVSAPVVAGQQVILRAVNMTGEPTVYGGYRFLQV